MKNKAFTLIELLVVIAIVAILASMLIGGIKAAAEHKQGNTLKNVPTDVLGH